MFLLRKFLIENSNQCLNFSTYGNLSSFCPKIFVAMKVTMTKKFSIPSIKWIRNLLHSFLFWNHLTMFTKLNGTGTSCTVIYNLKNSFKLCLHFDGIFLAMNFWQNRWQSFRQHSTFGPNVSLVLSQFQYWVLLSSFGLNSASQSASRQQKRKNYEVMKI